MKMGLEKELIKLSKLILNCKKCHLHSTRKNAIPGEGPPDPQIMFVGEAPGRMEDIGGRPFVGRAGKLFNELLNEVDISRRQIFIGNILKCRPVSIEGRDRRPTKVEISYCSPYLEKQLEIIKPKIVCALGNTSVSYFLKRQGIQPFTIGEVHGREFKMDLFVMIPSYHPAAALYVPDLKNTLREDFKKIRNLV